MVGSSQTQSLWEVGVDQEPLTSELALQRGYLLSVQNQKTVLEVPLFSIGYTYEVRNFGQPRWFIKAAVTTLHTVQGPNVCNAFSV